MAKYIDAVMTGVVIATSLIVAFKKGNCENLCLISLCIVGILGFCLVVGSNLIRSFEEKKMIRGYGLAVLTATTVVIIFYGFFL